jgi:hypothetical protein
MNNEAVIKALKEKGQQKEAGILHNVATELTDVQEAFELGLALQSLFEQECETSNTGVTTTEILTAIQFVRDNIQQAKY